MKLIFAAPTAAMLAGPARHPQMVPSANKKSDKGGKGGGKSGKNRR